MSKPSYIQRYGKKLAKRGDAWVCHYCEKPLTPLNISENDPEYYYLRGYEEKPDGSVIAHWRMRPQYGYPTIDHIHIKSNGGTDDLDNLVLACWKCNTERSTMPYAEFLAIVKARPKGYPHCVRCGNWYAETNAHDGLICAECVRKQVQR